jgi:hypothetical protein
MRHKKMFFVIGVLAAVCILFNQCVENKSADPRGPQYAGAGTCVSCHKEIAGSYAHTNHFKTSGKISDSILTTYVNPSNNTAYYLDSSMVRLDKTHNDFTSLI